MRRLCSRAMALGAAAAGLFLGPGPAGATFIGPGFDLFETQSATTFVTVDSKKVFLQGVRFIANTDIDTIVGRTGTLAAGATGPLTTQLTEIFLKSTAVFNYTGVGNADLYVTRNDAPAGTFPIPVYDALGVAPTGTLTVTTHNDGLGPAGGGTFTSTLPVVVDLVFTKVGGNPNNAADVLAHQVFDGRADPFTATGTWSHTPRADDPHPLLPSPFNQAGNFYPGVDPVTQAKVLTPEQAMLAAHGVLPGQTPEPASVVLFAVGLTGFVVLRRRSRAA